MFVEQDAEKVRQRRSRLAQRLNVPKRTPPSSLAAALLDSIFEHPARYLPLVQDLRPSKALTCLQSYQHPARTDAV